MQPIPGHITAGDPDGSGQGCPFRGRFTSGTYDYTDEYDSTEGYGGGSASGRGDLIGSGLGRGYGDGASQPRGTGYTNISGDMS